jgi:hypothetical protein
MVIPAAARTGTPSMVIDTAGSNATLLTFFSRETGLPMVALVALLF